MSRSLRLAMGIVGLLAVLLSVWGIRDVAAGLRTIYSTSHGVPLIFIGPETAMDASRPLILIAHGFAGSGTVMRGFAYTFAHAGYVVALWDFDGHGSNPNPMPPGLLSVDLMPDATTAFEAAERLGLADVRRVAILGHSMGSGVALMWGQIHPGTGATIAVSPIGVSVTPALPHNLLLIAGGLEPAFAENAAVLLGEAGGSGGEIADGSARKFVTIPGVEHISILFSPTAHATALAWLDATFGTQPGADRYTDRRILWFGLAVLGTLLSAATLVPRVILDERSAPLSRPLWWRSLALVVGAFAGTLALWAASHAGVDVATLLGLRVGGYLICWFAVAGMIAVLSLRPRIVLPGRRELLSGTLIFAFLWLGVGLIGGVVWLPWLLIPRRLLLWPLASLALLPWCLAVGEIGRRASAWGRLGWWLLQSVVLFAALTLAIRLSPEIGFLSLILPVFPIILLFQGVPNLPQRSSWSFALSGALFVSWMLLAVFPLQ